MKRYWRRTTLLGSLLFAWSAPAYGQWVQHSFQMQVGWNSVHLEVDPAPSEADALFAGLPIASVWFRADEPVTTLGPNCDGPNDPDCFSSTDTQWRVWLPSGRPAPIVTSLRIVRGGRVYLIRATQAFTWNVVGKPSGTETRWRPGFNLAGFHVVTDAGLRPTFQNYLSPSPAHGGTAVYRILPNGDVSLIPLTNQITPNLGFWVRSNSDVIYDGPLAIDPSTLAGIDFGSKQVQQAINIKNRASTPRNITLTYLPSAEAPSTSPPQPSNAGNVPLHRLDYGSGNQASNILQWRSLGVHTFALPAFALTVAPKTIEIGVRRVGLPAATVNIDGEGSQYQGLLEVTDGAGFRRLIGIAAQVADSFETSTRTATLGTGHRAGLYVGNVTVDRVAWVTAGARIWTNDDPTNPNFAGLMRCAGGSNNGNACFPDRKRCGGTPEIELMDVTCLTDADCAEGTCQTTSDCPGGLCNGYCIGGSAANRSCNSSTGCPQGTCSADLNNSLLRPVARSFDFPVILHLGTDGSYKMLTEVRLLADDDDAVVLATPDCDPMFCATLHGAETVNGQPQVRRISTAAFSFPDDLPLNGSFAGTLNGITTLTGNDPLNPFRHKFHPDHDCNEPGECYDVTRTFVFSFEAAPPTGISDLEWGDSVVGGVYTEQVAGLHRETITAQGRFRLERISQIGVLNTAVGGSKLR